MWFSALIVYLLFLKCIFLPFADDISITSGLIDRMVVSEGSNITHRCTAVSLPAPVLVWRINGTMISSERYRVIAGASTTDGSVTSTLQVTNTISSDSALIECVAINTAGNTPQAISSSSLVTIISESACLSVHLFGICLFMLGHTRGNLLLCEKNCFYIMILV